MLKQKKKNNKCDESDSQENDNTPLKNEDGSFNEITLTIKDYNHNNNVTQMKLNVNQIIAALKKKKPKDNRNKEHNDVMRKKKQN